MTRENVANPGRTSGAGRNAPRAIIHKQILDYAEANPEESMEAIAEAVSGATTSTVERVLEEYGDPADDHGPAATPSTGGTSTVTDGGAASDALESAPGPAVTTSDGSDSGGAESESAPEPVLDLSSLTEKQRETLRAIYDHPDATQADLADRLGVSSPTISQRVNSIEGFDWSNRYALVEPLFDSDETDGVAEDDRRASADVEETDGGTTPTDPQSSGDDSTEADRDGSDAAGDSRPDSSDRDRRTDPAGTGSESAGTEQSTDRATADSSDGAVDDDRLADLENQIDDLTRRLETMGQELESLEERGAQEPSSSVLADPELAHKIIYACFNSDRITEEEELRLLRDVTAGKPAAHSVGEQGGSS